MKRTNQECVVGRNSRYCVTQRIYTDENGKRYIKDKDAESGYRCIEGTNLAEHVITSWGRR